MKKFLIIYLAFSALTSFGQVEVGQDSRVSVGEVAQESDVQLTVSNSLRVKKTEGVLNSIDAGKLDFIESGTEIGASAYGFQFFHNGTADILELNGYSSVTKFPIVDFYRGGKSNFGKTIYHQGKINIQGSIYQEVNDIPVIAIGSIGSLPSLSGWHNTLIGYDVSTEISSGTKNTFVGSRSGRDITVGSNDTEHFGAKTRKSIRNNLWIHAFQHHSDFASLGIG
jgi:hypothetical protein